MNDIDSMPPKCGDCPYWELASPPYICEECLKGGQEEKAN